MALKALEIYQGSDWFTYRLPVAQAYDTLERMQDICLSRAWEPGEPTQDIDEILNDVMDLCDDLTAELASVEADIFPVSQSQTPQRWMAFEMNYYLALIRQKAAPSSYLEPAHLFDDILMQIKRIKKILKQLDQ